MTKLREERIKKQNQHQIIPREDTKRSKVHTALHEKNRAKHLPFSCAALMHKDQMLLNYKSEPGKFPRLCESACESRTHTHLVTLR
jgi:hypothetical protein